MKRKMTAMILALAAWCLIAAPMRAEAQGLSSYYNVDAAPGSIVLGPDELVQEAFRFCIAQGMDSASAFWLVKANLNAIAFAVPATPERVQAVVREEMTAANTLVNAAAVPVQGRNGAAGARAEQECVQRAFANLVAGGMSPTDAYNFVRDNLSVILAAGGF